MLGLLGSGHCLGMCGGIMAALGMGCRKNTTAGLLMILLAYNAGRINSYIIAALLVGALGLWLQSLHTSIGFSMRMISGFLLLLMGFYLTGWWRILTRLEQLGEQLWRHIQPLGKRLMPVETLPHAFLLGLIWGWLPCGLVYSMLAYTATSESLPQAVLIMLCFGLGTLPSLLVTGLFAEQLQLLIQKKSVRTISGILVILFGCWTLFGAAVHMSGNFNHNHESTNHRQPESGDQQSVTPHVHQH